jgi:hypothetical protein
MKRLLVATLFSSVVLTTSLVRAQGGLYGAPAMLDLPQAQAAPSYSSPSTSVVPLPSASSSVYLTASVPQPGYLPSNAAYGQQIGDVSMSSAPGASGPGQPTIPTPAPPNPMVPGGGPSMNPPSYNAPSALPSAPSGAQGMYSPQPASPGAYPATPGNGVVNQMLQESGCYGNGGAASGPVPGAYGPNPCAEGFGGGSMADQWYASVRGLIMGRGETPKIWTSANSVINANQLLNTQVNENWAGGWDVVLGHSFCCGQYSMEVEYWGLSEFGGQAATSPSQGPVNLTFQDNNLAFTQNGTTYTGQQMFDGAVAHAIQRENDVQSVEINLFHNHCGCAGNMDVAFSAGVRYFRFRDQLDFTSFTNYAAPFDQAQLSDRVVNNLMGFQFGADVSYNLGCNLHFFLNPKVGIYDNHMNLNYNVTNSCGTPAVSTDPNVPGGYPVNASKDGLAFMTQFDIGLGWQFACHWDAFIGYRVLFATGMGLADNQMPMYFVDLPGIADIKHSGDLVLTGAFAGLTYSF